MTLEVGFEGPSPEGRAASLEYEAGWLPRKRPLWDDTDSGVNGPQAGMLEALALGFVVPPFSHFTHLQVPGCPVMLLSFA